MKNYFDICNVHNYCLIVTKQCWVDLWCQFHLENLIPFLFLDWFLDIFLSFFFLMLSECTDLNFLCACLFHRLLLLLLLDINIFTVLFMFFYPSLITSIWNIKNIYIFHTNRFWSQKVQLHFVSQVQECVVAEKRHLNNICIFFLFFVSFSDVCYLKLLVLTLFFLPFVILNCEPQAKFSYSFIHFLELLAKKIFSAESFKHFLHMKSS